NYRIITVYTNKYQDALEIKLNIPENKEIYKRRIVVERSFAHMKYNLDFTQANTRELDKIESEVKCVAAASNIRLLHNHKLKLLKQT
ncbi:transposase, partial [Methanobrevibacter filiformis]|uniref:transposase n=1 Tax=Methanobrevibacter filiformis TaxID=55758 RepID=UPI0008359A35